MEETPDQLVEISQNFEKSKIEDLMEFPEINSLKIEQEISKFLFKKINSSQYQDHRKTNLSM